MNNNEKGLLYELYIKNFIIHNFKKNAYLWNECPENILINNNLIDSHNDMRLIRKDIKNGYLHNHKDIGIDIIQIDNNDNTICSIVQCKNGYSNGLCVNDISGIMMRTAFLKNVNSYIYYTDSLSRNIKYTSKISPNVINIDCSNNIDKLLEIKTDNKIFFIKLPYQNIIHTNNNISAIIPYTYQIEAFNNFKKYFNNNNRGILSLPCGCGKTFTAFLISNNYNQIIIISPLREFANQNLNKFIEYGYDKNNSLLIDTDGIRDLDYIKNFIQNKQSFLLSCTYKSMDLISKCLDLFNNSLFIIDEFHNLSKANLTDSNNDIFKLLISNHYILFMSATPRIYDIEYDDNDIDIDCLLGDIVYQMKFNDAISNKFITDYIIWLPSIHENNDELDKELSIYDIDNEIKNRCKFLYSCILNNGSRKCIIYCKDTNDMHDIMNSMIALNEFYIMNFELYSISCEDNENKRKKTLEMFASNNDKIQLLFNIKILNECIDINTCDSIYISYPPINKITTIQRISRATRINIHNPYKIANIYIWCNQYDEILETLSSIKEYDLFFKDKININSLNFYNIKSNNKLKLIENDKLLINNYIIGIKEFKFYTWKEKLELVNNYIIDNQKIPTERDKNKDIKILGKWISHQKQNYKNNENNMKNEEIRKEWKYFINKYNDLFKSNEEIWKEKLELINNYIIDNKKLPSSTNKNKDIKILGSWIANIKNNYKNNEKNMKNEEIRKEWENFINKYNDLFKSNEEIWKEKLELVNNYIVDNQKLPSRSDKNKDIKILGSWIANIKNKYKKNQEIMKNEEIRKEWVDFINKYNNLFKSNEET